MIVLRAVIFLIGLAVVFGTVISAIRTFVLPRGVRDPLTRIVFLMVRRFFNLRVRKATSYDERDRIMAFFAPISLLALPAVWLGLVLLGYTAMFWAIGVLQWGAAFTISGSSLLTLGFATGTTAGTTALTFSEAAIGLTLAALLIAYLPTMYAAFSRREAAVTMLEVRAGSPPSVAEMIARFHRIGALGHISETWAAWEAWFVDIEESHTSLGALAFYRSPQAHRSWVTAAGAVLDTASFVSAAVDVPRDPQAELCIRAGFLALRQICDFFQIPYNPAPHYPEQPVSVAREEFDAVYDQLATLGIALKPDREQAWRDFAGWRVNYDTVLLALATLTMAPYAPWSSDRSLLPPGQVSSRAVGRATQQTKREA